MRIRVPNPPARTPERALTRPTLIDERSDPDLRSLYGRLARRAAELDAAVARIRLSGMNLDGAELEGLRSIRVLVARTDVLALSAEADRMAADAGRVGRIRLLASLLDAGRLEVRISPLAGWSPDFSCFRGSRAGDAPVEPSVLIGPHWFERPYPHPGPALGVLVEGAQALAAHRRFEEAWVRAHDLNRSVRSVLARALRRARREEAPAKARR